MKVRHNMRHVSRSSQADLVDSDDPESKLVPDIERDRVFDIFRQWATLSSQEQKIAKRRAELRPALLEYAAQAGETDPKGHKTVYLTLPLEVAGDRTYDGWVREKRTTRTLNEDRVREMAEKLGLTDLIFRKETIEIMDQDVIYALEQEEIITADDVEGLIDTHTTYALKRI